MAQQLAQLDIRDRQKWHQWLDRHHESSPGVWLVFHKKHTGVKSIPYEDSVCEALCFGWVDSLVKRLDEDRYLLKFTPRRPESIWSDANRKRYAKLKASGQLTPAGVRNAPTDRRYGAVPTRITKVPQFIQDALKKHSAAQRTFDALHPTQQLRYAMWIDSAKRAETKSRRLQEAIRLLAAGSRLGLK